MAQTKKMNETAFEKLVKEANAVGELIKTFQDEKQAVIEDFASERKRFSNGKISRTALQSSAKKSNKELAKLDEKIRFSIQKINKLTLQMKKFASKQSPRVIRVKVASAGKKKAKKVGSVKKTTKKKK